MDKLRPFLLPGVAAVGYLAWLLFAPGAGTEDSGTAASPAPATPAGAHDQGSGPGAASTPRPGEGRAPAPATAAHRRAARDAMLLRIDAALHHRGEPRARADDDGGDDDHDDGAGAATGSLDRDYIQARFREDLLPVAQECYESALEDVPDLAGKLVMEFSIAGDESVGGVVTRSEISDESDLQHAGLRECLRETTFTLTFPPPEGGGRVDVKYPVVFSPEDPPEKAR